MQMLEQIYTHIKTILGDNQFAQGGALIAVFSWILYSVKPIPGKIYQALKKLVYYEMSIYLDREDDTYSIFSDWYNKTYPTKCRRSIIKINVSSTDNGPKQVSASYRQDSDVNYIWYRRRLIRIEKTRSKLEHASSGHDAYTDEYHISGLFASRSILGMVKDIINDYKKSLLLETGINFRIYDPIYGGSRFKHIMKFKTFDQLFFNGKDKLLNYLDNWQKNQTKSDRMGICHKTGISLYGPPGTGKTSIAKAIAHRYAMELNMISLGSFKSDADLVNYIQGLNPFTVLLFEDVDDFIGLNNRTKLNSESKISFSTLLQILDGVISPDNVIFVFTTNQIAELDPALYRDGRINFRLLVDYPASEDIIKFVENYYDEKWTQPIIIPEKISMSTVEQKILQHNNITNAIIDIAKHND